MPVGWALVPYKRRVGSPFGVVRYCAVDDFTAQIKADGGAWSASECLGNYAVVKARASAATLTAIAAAPGVVRIPARFTAVGVTLGDLTTGERTAILNRLTALGYTTAEIQAALGSTLGQWRTRTLRQVLRFALTRRLKPRYDEASDTVILDGIVQTPTPLERVDEAVV